MALDVNAKIVQSFLQENDANYVLIASLMSAVDEQGKIKRSTDETGFEDLGYDSALVRTLESRLSLSFLDRLKIIFWENLGFDFDSRAVRVAKIVKEVWPVLEKSLQETKTDEQKPQKQLSPLRVEDRPPSRRQRVVKRVQENGEALFMSYLEALTP